jgi:hypothetical protein
MRFFEIADNQQQPVDPAVPATTPVAKTVAPKKVATLAPVSATKTMPATDTPPAIKKPAVKKAATPVYADSKQIKDTIAFLQQQLPDGTFKPQNAKGVKRVASIRARGISLASLKAAMTAFGGTTTSPTADQITASSSFPANSFEKDGVLYTVVIGMKGVKGDDESSVGLSRKELTPTGLGLQGGIFDKTELINATKKAVDSKIRKRDPVLADALIAMVDSAGAGGTQPIDPALMSHIAPYLGTLSQDFGEILAPILIMKKGQKAELPTGNNPLVDVKIPGMNLSVKALTGSGTSFRSISDLMDKYESSITNDPESKKHFEVLKAFHPSAGGKNVDKIIKAAAKANIKEYKEAVRKFGAFEDYAGLERRASAFNWRNGSVASYRDFLQLSLDVFTASDSGGTKFVGMPADGKFYLGSDGAKKPPKQKAAGYPSFRASPFKAAADIITYSLGVGLLNYVKGGKNADKYKTMMTDIVNKADAVIGHITVNKDGTMSLVTKPFSTLQFQFQYHAPSHIPGNNLPGFIALLD